MVILNVLLLISALNIENVSDISKPKIDVVSLLLSTVAFGGLIYALSTLAETPFASPAVWAPLLAGIAALGLFIFRQLKMPEACGSHSSDISL